MIFKDFNIGGKQATKLDVNGKRVKTLHVAGKQVKMVEPLTIQVLKPFNSGDLSIKSSTTLKVDFTIECFNSAGVSIGELRVD